MHDQSPAIRGSCHVHGLKEGTPARFDNLVSDTLASVRVHIRQNNRCSFAREQQ
jgi:hypothetical protein